MADEFLEAWQTNHRINQLIIDALDEDGLSSSLSTRGGRDVARQFAHLHNIRIQQLIHRRAGDLADGLTPFESKHSPSAAELTAALETSTEAVGRFLVDLANGTGRRKGFRKGVATTLSYFIAHESHHRGSILLTLKQCGRALPKEVSYGIWDWERR